MSGAASARSGPAVYRRLLGYAGRHWPLAVVAATGMLLEAAAAGAFTALMRPLIDGTFVERDPETIRWLPIAIVVIFVVRGIATFCSDVGMSRIGRRVVRALRGEVIRKYLALPAREFDAQPAAQMVSRLTYNTEQVMQSTAEAVKIMVTDSLTIAALLTVMLMQSVRLTATLLVMVPLIAAIVVTVGKRYRRLSGQIQASVAEMAHSAEQAVAGQHEVKIYGAQAQEAARFEGLATRNLRLHQKIEATKALSSSLVQLLAALALAVIVYIAGREAARDDLTAGMFMALISAMMAMLPSLKRITNVQTMLGRGIAAAAGLFDVLDASSERDAGTVPIDRARGRVEFRGVRVRYTPEKPAALDGVDLVLEPGTMTAVVGRSGSGKTTLARLLPRLYEPDEGEVLLDGVPLPQIRLADLRRQIALVSQHVVLFDDTVAHNIAYGALAGADRERLREAAQRAHALGFIEQLPGGFEARIGDGGALLSGGQRQRLAIARAILKDAPILILDEATAALDAESERAVQQALDEVARGRTTIVIAHRLSTVERADQVVVLDQGRVVERGTPAELLGRGGLYAHLHRLSFRDEAA